MNHEYFKVGLDKIAEVCKILDDSKVCHWIDRPEKISFMEQWMADGFFIRWTIPTDLEFEVCCIWCQRGSKEEVLRAEVIGAAIFRRTWHTETEHHSFKRVWDAKIESDEELVAAFKKWVDMMDIEALATPVDESD